MPISQNILQISRLWCIMYTGVIDMFGIDLNKPIFFSHASMRYFNAGEHHVTRFCKDDVLLMVFDGILRFTEDGVSYEVGQGQYHIQHHGRHQSGSVASDEPKYLYVHFHGEWGEGERCLPRSGEFDIDALRERMERLDHLSHTRHTLTEKSGCFLDIISIIYAKTSRAETGAAKIKEYIRTAYRSEVKLENIAEHFHFSKNHVINLFEREYGITPFVYLYEVRIREAKRMLEATSQSTEDIAYKCGYGTYSNFYRQFKKATGLSPTEWRKKTRITPSV